MHQNTCKLEEEDVLRRGEFYQIRIAIAIITIFFNVGGFFLRGGGDQRKVKSGLSEGHLLIRSYDDKTVSVNLKFYASK